MIDFYLNSGNYLEICRSYQEIYQTASIAADVQSWTDALRSAVIYAILSPHGPEQHDLLLRFQQLKKKIDVPDVEYVQYCAKSNTSSGALEFFTTHELMPRPIPQEQEWKENNAFTGEHGERAVKDLHDRINEHVRGSIYVC